MKIFYLLLSWLFAFHARSDALDQSAIALDNEKVNVVIGLFRASHEGGAAAIPDWASVIEFETIGFTSGKHAILPNNNETLCNISIRKKLGSGGESMVIFRFTVAPLISIKGGKRDKTKLGQILSGHTITQALVVESKMSGKKREVKELLLLRRK